MKAAGKTTITFLPSSLEFRVLRGYLGRLLCLLAIGAACRPFANALADNVVAVVNGLPVTIEEVSDRFARLQSSLGSQSPRGDEEIRVLKQAIVKELIQRQLLLAEAARRKLSVSDAEVARTRERLANGLTAEEVNETLKEARTTPAALETSLKEELLLRKLMDDLSSVIDVSESETATYYEQHKSQFLQEESVRARHIVVRTEPEARKVRHRLMAGEDFLAVARQVSKGPAAKAGGDLGLLQRGQMPRELEDVAFSLHPGQVSQIIESPYGFHILRVEEHLQSRQLSLAEVKNRLVSLVKEQKREERFRLLLTDLWRTATIDYNRNHAAILPQKAS